MTVEPDIRRYALIPPEECPSCEREADAIEVAMKQAGISDPRSIDLARMRARCYAHRVRPDA